MIMSQNDDNRQEDHQREFEGLWIPKEAWFDSSLSLLQKIILTQIYSLYGPDGCCASNQYLMHSCGVNERTLQRALRRLKEVSYIFIERTDGRKRFLRVNSIERKKKPLQKERLTKNQSQHGGMYHDRK